MAARNPGNGQVLDPATTLRPGGIAEEGPDKADHRYPVWGC